VVFSWPYDLAEDAVAALVEEALGPVASGRYTESFDCVRLAPHFAQDDSADFANQMMVDKAATAAKSRGKRISCGTPEGVS
jgi:hypothetical protein